MIEREVAADNRAVAPFTGGTDLYPHNRPGVTVSPKNPTHRPNTKRAASLLALIIVAALALPSVALAQSSSVSGYGGNGGETQGVLGASNAGGPSGDGAAGSTTASDSGTLPFTGLDLTMMIAGGLILVAAGVGIARATGKTGPAEAA